MSIFDRLFRRKGPEPEEELHIDDQAFTDEELIEFFAEFEDAVREATADQTHEVPTRSLMASDLVRRIHYDTRLSRPEDFLSILGMTKQSPEVEEMSRRESDRRIQLVTPLAPMVVFMVDAFVTGIATYTVKNRDEVLGGYDISDDDLEKALDNRQAEMRAVVLAVLANLIDLGIIEVISSTHLRECDHDHDHE